MVSLLPAAVRNASDPARDFRMAWVASLGLGSLLLVAVGVEGRQPMLLPAGWFVGLFLSGLHLVRAPWPRVTGPGQEDRRAYSDAGVLLALAWAIAVPLLAQEASVSLCFLLAGVLSSVARLVRPLVMGERLRLGLCAGLLGLPMLILLLQGGTPLEFLLAGVVLVHILVFVSPEPGEGDARGLPDCPEQMQRGDRLPADFMVVAAGEMRPAVHAILGLLQGCRPEDGGDQATCRERLRGAARHLLGLIDAVADIARVHVGADVDASYTAFALDVDRVALDELVGNVIASHAPAAAARSTQLHVDMAPLPSCLLGDGARIIHALHSLVAQGVSLTRQGKVTLEVRGARESRLGVLVEFRLGACASGLAPGQLEQLLKDAEPGGVPCAFGPFGLRLLHLRHLAAQMGGEAGVLMGGQDGVTVWFSAWLARQGGRDAPTAPVAAPAG